MNDDINQGDAVPCSICSRIILKGDRLYIRDVISVVDGEQKDAPTCGKCEDYCIAEILELR